MRFFFSPFENVAVRREEKHKTKIIQQQIHTQQYEIECKYLPRYLNTKQSIFNQKLPRNHFNRNISSHIGVCLVCTLHRDLNQHIFFASLALRLLLMFDYHLKWERKGRIGRLRCMRLKCEIRSIDFVLCWEISVEFYFYRLWMPFTYNKWCVKYAVHYQLAKGGACSSSLHRLSCTRDVIVHLSHWIRSFIPDSLTHDRFCSRFFFVHHEIDGQFNLESLGWFGIIWNH